MAFAMHHLFRLPSTLRRHVLDNASLFHRPQELQQYQVRIQPISRRPYSQKKPTASPRPAPPKPTVKKAGASPSQAAPPRPSVYRSSGNSYADRLCHNAEQVLIYNSPSHTSYTLTSYFFGGVLLIGAAFTASLAKDPPSEAGATPKPIPYWVRALNLIPTIASAMIATMFLLAPTKLIRRVWLLRPKSQTFSAIPGQYTLQLEIKSALPFRRTSRTISAPLHDVSIDRSIRSANQDLSWHSVPLSSSAAFTAHYLPSTHPQHVRGTPPPHTLSSRLSGANAALLNAWPVFQRNVKRMFVREGIAYVHVVGEGGQWKLDLHEAEVLDGGQPLAHLMQTDVQMAKGVVPYLQRVVAAIQGARGA